MLGRKCYFEKQSPSLSLFHTIWHYSLVLCLVGPHGTTPSGPLHGSLFAYPFLSIPYQCVKEDEWTNCRGWRLRVLFSYKRIVPLGPFFFWWEADSWSLQRICCCKSLSFLLRVVVARMFKGDACLCRFCGSQHSPRCRHNVLQAF